MSVGFPFGTTSSCSIGWHMPSLPACSFPQHSAVDAVSPRAKSNEIRTTFEPVLNSRILMNRMTARKRCGEYSCSCLLQARGLAGLDPGSIDSRVLLQSVSSRTGGTRLASEKLLLQRAPPISRLQGTTYKPRASYFALHQGSRLPSSNHGAAVVQGLPCSLARRVRK